MAEAVVGGAFLSAFLQVLFDRMASREVLDFVRGRNLNHELLNKLKITLMSISAVLNDAEEKHIKNAAVKEWLNELKDAAYNAQDLLDEIATDASRYKLEAELKMSTSQVRNFFSTSLNPSYKRVETKLEGILNRLEFLANQRDILGLKEGDGGEKPSRTLPSTSLVEESSVFSRGDDKEAIVKLLLSDDGSNISVIPMWAWLGLARPPLGQLPSLKDLSIVGLELEMTVGEEFYGTSYSGSKIFVSLDTLRFMNMLDWQKGFHFRDKNGVAAFPRLQQLHIQNCPKLTEGLPLYCLSSLTKLVINECQQLEASLPRAPAIRELKLSHCNKVLLNDLPLQLPQLLKLTISGYRTLQSLLEDINNCLEELDISDCPSLMYIPSNGITGTLKSLDVWNCGDLEFPKHPYASLESLCIRCSCNSLESFPLGFFPKLNHLDICGCQNLKSLSISEGPLQHLTSLTSLRISWCSNFVSFPNAGLPAPNLTWLCIDNCKNLKLLPTQTRSLLPSLRTLSIWDLELELFPDGGLPSSLHLLEVCYCEKLISNCKEWGLQKLPSLRSFCIRGRCESVQPFPEKELLPSSLTSLYKWHLPFLKSLDSNGLQHLTSLQHLAIGFCPNLQSMPGEGLPTSLSYLSIKKCPLLKQSCRREKGEDWPKIAHIPFIKIDEEVISA